MKYMRMKRAQEEYSEYRRTSHREISFDAWVNSRGIIVSKNKNGNVNRRRKKDKKSKHKLKTKGTNRHHLLNKCHGGGWETENILEFNMDRHNYWHRIFRNLSLKEVIELLIRMYHMKHHEVIEGECPVFKEAL